MSYAYDNLDRLRVKTVPTWGTASGHVVSTSFSLAGRITGESDSAGPGLSYSFDTAGRATAELQLTNGASRTVTWTLDAMGNHTRLTWPDAFAVNYTFDALNRMSIVSVNGGAVLAAYTYDPLSRRTAVSYNSGTSAMDYTYTSAGDLLTLTDDFAGTTNDVTFTDTYTNAHQLQTETISNSAYIWTPPTPTGHDSYGTVNNLNQYPTLNSGALTWDANGNLGAMAGATYTHDAENRMVAASGTATAASYTYDPLNRRVAKTVTSPTTTYLHDGSNEISEYDNTGALVRRFVPGAAIDEPVAMVTASGATTFFHTDRKGSVIAMADTTGARVEGPYTYDAYGNCFVGATTTSCTTLAATAEPFRYTGQRFDAETGLYYYRARYYCVGIGRFCETDPAGYKDDLNWYSAFGNDPTDMSDPTGLLAASDCGTGSNIKGGGDGAGCGVVDGFEDSGKQRNSGRRSEQEGSLGQGNGLIVAASWPSNGGPPLEPEIACPEVPLACVLPILPVIMSGPIGHEGPISSDQDRGQKAQNAIHDHLGPRDLDGARRELRGERFYKSDGKPWNHVREVRDGQNALRNRILRINEISRTEDLSAGEQLYYNRELSQLSRFLDYTEGFVP